MEQPSLAPDKWNDSWYLKQFLVVVKDHHNTPFLFPWYHLSPKNLVDWRQGKYSCFYRKKYFFDTFLYEVLYSFPSFSEECVCTCWHCLGCSCLRYLLPQAKGNKRPLALTGDRSHAGGKFCSKTHWSKFQQPSYLPSPQQKLQDTSVLKPGDAPMKGCFAQTTCESRQVSVSSLREKIRTSPCPQLILLVKQVWSFLNERMKIVLLEEKQYWIQLCNTVHQIDYNTLYS